MIVHFPVVEITHFLLGLRNNPVFLRISHILMLSLVALSAIGHAGEWAKGLEPWMPGCTVPVWGCYQGEPLTLNEYIDHLGAPKSLLFCPIFDLSAALLLLFRPSRTYLVLLLCSFATFFSQLLGSDPIPYTNVLSGDGFWLAQLSLFFLFLLSLPLAIVEQSRLHPEIDYQKYLPVS